MSITGKLLNLKQVNLKKTLMTHVSHCFHIPKKISIPRDPESQILKVGRIFGCETYMTGKEAKIL
jgi:hypothetical protein